MPSQALPSTTVRDEAEEALVIPLRVRPNADDDFDGCGTTEVLVSDEICGVIRTSDVPGIT